MAQKEPFSARYSLPARLADNLDEMTWENVSKMSPDFQINVEEHRIEARRTLRELQLSRLLLLDRIRQGSKDGRIDPKLLVEAVRLLERAEEVSKLYGIDLSEFARFLFLVSEKLKREKLAKHRGFLEQPGAISGMRPMNDLPRAFAPARKRKPKKGRKK
jgi:hypothetical protein